MADTYKRVQMLLKPEQHRLLAKMARQQGKSVAEVTRQVIDTGLNELERRDEFQARSRALQQAEALRKASRTRRGRPLEIDIVADIEKMRVERDDHIIHGSS